MELQPFDPWTVVIRAVFDPFVIVVAFTMGRFADQWQKLLVAGFAAALVGYGTLWLATYFGLTPIKGVGAATGVFIVQFVLGIFWAWLGYRSAPKQEPEGRADG